MLIYALAFLSGILTIVGPCILPVLPFVFSRADQPFRRSGLPLLARVALTFAVVASVSGKRNSEGYRLYQLIRQKGKIEDRTFQIEFLDPGVQAFAFTFG